MDSINFGELEIDAIGEILNISLGASATAVSTMLNSRVDITTPIVQVMEKKEFEFANLEPAVGVEITYVTGLSGNNIMLLKRHDVKIIVDMLMGMETPDAEFELNELNISAICEVMNQMMGASSTALSEFLDKPVNISTPTSFEIKDEESFKDKYFTEDRPMVVVNFTLKIGDQLCSEFINVMPPELAKELVHNFLPEGFDEPEEPAPVVETPSYAPPEPEPKEPEPASSGGSSGGILSQDEIERLLAGMGGDEPEEEEPIKEPEPQPAPQPQVQPEPTPQYAPQPQPMPQPQPQPQYAPQPQVQPAPQYTAQPMDMSVVAPQMNAAASAAYAETAQTMAQMQQMMMQMQQQMMMMMQNNAASKTPAKEAAEPKTISVHPAPGAKLDGEETFGEEQEANRELIMGVPLEISVEIGRTTKLVKDILEFTKGSLVILDKLAGEQVDLFVNGQCIAKGDVVVIDDNFGIRITEIVKRHITP